MPKSVDERFDEKVEPEPMSGCHLWMAFINPDGYGTFRGGASRLAHRFSYERAHGPIPEGMVIDHVCRNRACVNPDHLRAVTRWQNVHENSDAAAHRNSLKTHCDNGHAFTPENTYWQGPERRWRACEKCRQRNRERYLERKRES